MKTITTTTTTTTTSGRRKRKMRRKRINTRNSYILCEWLKSQPREALHKKTKAEVARLATKKLRFYVSNYALGEAMEMTGITWEPPRSKERVWRDRLLNLEARVFRLERGMAMLDEQLDVDLEELLEQMEMEQEDTEEEEGVEDEGEEEDLKDE